MIKILCICNHCFFCCCFKARGIKLKISGTRKILALSTTCDNYNKLFNIRTKNIFMNQIFEITLRYTNADLKTSPYVRAHIIIIP